MPNIQRRIPWGRLGLEGVVIVVSILLAFAIQAWWEGQNDARQRRTLLLGLVNDFEAAAGDLARVSALHADGLAATAELMRLTADGATEQLGAAAVDSLLTAATMGGTFDPPLGTVDAILGSGSLSVLESDLLASELTAWPARVRDLSQVEQLVTELTLELFGVLASHGVDASNLVWHESYSNLPWTPRRTIAYQVVDEVEVRQLIGSLWFQYGNSTEKQRELRESWDRIRPLLLAGR